ncbi:hypothetical protein CBR_g50186 [Chara braunii]|uniref:Uncharacterized protein n=1 Tax=Chara braunii TaxID=69332 RepID=A0A388M6J1_CHABU|nr:hypothetical protein CBR_g50186 [Chara braunii]|eukprot:GBG90093.1 hypothetical protein CBR_g50186 [Chara braunii]
MSTPTTIPSLAATTGAMVAPLTEAATAELPITTSISITLSSVEVGPSNNLGRVWQRELFAQGHAVWGLEEEPPPYMELTDLSRSKALKSCGSEILDLPRSNAPKSCACKTLEEGQGFGGKLEVHFYKNDDDYFADGFWANNTAETVLSRSRVMAPVSQMFSKPGTMEALDTRAENKMMGINSIPSKRVRGGNSLLFYQGAMRQNVMRQLSPSPYSRPGVEQVTFSGWNRDRNMKDNKLQETSLMVIDPKVWPTTQIHSEESHSQEEAAPRVERILHSENRQREQREQRIPQVFLSMKTPGTEEE